ncbi:MAG TPA: hypothetical protein PLJ47_01090 [Candidatus Hydrogenedentes bacterium]|nr:hypothetical protein [Candidatus Hydrogenedentota bacterium]
MSKVYNYLFTGAMLVATILIPSCGQPTGTQEITETRTLTTPKEAPPATLSSAERLGMVRQPAAGAEAQPKFTWTTPQGWTELPTSQLRSINLRPAGDENAECYMTMLAGGGGGLAANVNRWRGQMGQEPLDEAAITALPKKKLLGMDASYVEVEGTYGGMSGDQQRPDYKLAGLILAAGDMAVTVKLTGPKALIDAELANFEAFCGSISLGAPNDAHQHAEAPAADPAAPATPMTEDAALPPNHPPIDGAAAMPQASSGLGLTAPAGWTQSGPRPMREVSFTMGASGKTECYIAKLSNRGGGLEANLNRWAGQMGLPPLTHEAIAALPTVTVFGESRPLVEFRGTYTDMSQTSFADYVMLGTIAEVGSDAYFVKMTGPAAEVEAEKSNFASFCESLKLSS